jgi:hypothetical protein
MSAGCKTFLFFHVTIHIMTIILVLREMNSSRYHRLNESEKVVKNKGVFWLLILTGGIGAALFFIPRFCGRLFSEVARNYKKL